MRESSMMGKSENRPSKVAEYVEIGGLCCQRHRSGRKSGFSIKPGARETCAGQKVSDGFQNDVL